MSAPGRQPAGQTKTYRLTFSSQFHARIYPRHVYQCIEKLEEVEGFHQLNDQLEDRS